MTQGTHSVGMYSYKCPHKIGEVRTLARAQRWGKF